MLKILATSSCLRLILYGNPTRNTKPQCLELMRRYCSACPRIENQLKIGGHFGTLALSTRVRLHSSHQWRAFLNPESKRYLLHTKSLCTKEEKDTAADRINSEKDILSLSPHNFAQFLRKYKINRCFILWDEDQKKPVVSHPELQPIAEWLIADAKSSRYRKHDAIFLQVGIRTGILLAAFVWRSNRGQACGGISMQKYSTMEQFFGDGLWLSHRLGIKSSLAGLWIGGGKGLIAEPLNREHYLPDFRQKIFYDYGDFVSSLNGCYVAGIDIGVNTQDLYNVHSRTRWTVCIPEDIGGSGSPSKLLSKGIICAMQAALDYLNMGTLERKSVAIQGAGAVGYNLASSLLDHGVSHVYVTETNQKRADDLQDSLRLKAHGRLKVRRVDVGDMSVFDYGCDIVSPCAIGNVLTERTIPEIQAKIICGSANSQLANDDYYHLIKEQGITYVLEYLPNRMAIVNSAYEAYGRMPNDPFLDKHFDKWWKHSIYVLTKQILENAEKNNISVLEAAMRLADAYSEENHPLWPGRCRNIIQALKETGWHNGHDFWRKRSSFAISEGCA